MAGKYPEELREDVVAAAKNRKARVSRSRSLLISGPAMHVDELTAPSKHRRWCP